MVESKEVFEEVYLVYDKNEDVIDEFYTFDDALKMAKSDDNAVSINKVLFREDEDGESYVDDVEEVFRKGTDESLDTIKEDFVSVSDLIKNKAASLADYLNIDKKSLKYMQYGEMDNFIAPDGDEYLVCTDEEADKLAKEQIIELLDELGIESLSKEFASDILNDSDYIDVDWFEDALKEDMESYVSDIEYETYDTKYANRLIDELVENDIVSEEDITDDGELFDDMDIDELKEEYVDYLVDNAGDPVEYFRDNFGDEWFSNTVKQNGLLNYDAVAEEVINLDGRGPSLATYDGKEVELDDDFFAYKQDENADDTNADSIFEESIDEPLNEDKNTDYNDLFVDFLDLIEFDLVKVDDEFKADLKKELGDEYDEDYIGKYALHDRQGANLGDIESITFDSASDILDNLEMYVEDYIIDALKDIAEGTQFEDLLYDGSWEDFVDWYNEHKDEEDVKEVFGDSEYDIKTLDMLVHHLNDVDLDKVYNKYFAESLKEDVEDDWQVGNTFSDFGRDYKIIKTLDSKDVDGYELSVVEAIPENPDEDDDPNEHTYAVLLDGDIEWGTCSTYEEAKEWYDDIEDGYYEDGYYDDDDEDDDEFDFMDDDDMDESIADSNKKSVKIKENNGVPKKHLTVWQMEILPDKKYDIILDHTIDDYKRIYTKDSLLKNEYALKKIMDAYDLSREDLIKFINYKYDGIVDESMIYRHKKSNISEDTVKLKNGKWANVGDDGKVDSGEFTTKKKADAQRKAMFANKGAKR